MKLFVFIVTDMTALSLQEIDPFNLITVIVNSFEVSNVKLISII